MMLSLAQISKNLGEFRLKDISLEVGKGEYFALLGPSGAGKSILFEIIAGIIRQQSGRIILEGKDISKTPAQQREIGLVFQDNALFPHIPVWKNIAYPLKIQGYNKVEIRERINSLATDFSVSHLLERMPPTLSGGEQQRVAIARSMAHNPKCLLLDEPLSSLDVMLREDIRGLLKRINEEGLTILHITHDYREAFYLADKIAVIRDGLLLRADNKENIRKQPGSRFVAELIGYRNIFPYSSENGNTKIKGINIAQAESSKNSNGWLIIPDDAIVLDTDLPRKSSNSIIALVSEILAMPGFTEIKLDIGPILNKTVPGTSNSFEIGERIPICIDPKEIIFL
ncbi:MAG: ATP-binding cassette domain-containing protein [Bacteroidales bacterium]|nr:ATP-binding cassette domain-containing protein [Bacteroidales bacterium]